MLPPELLCFMEGTRADESCRDDGLAVLDPQDDLDDDGDINNSSNNYAIHCTYYTKISDDDDDDDNNNNNNNNNNKYNISNNNLHYHHHHHHRLRLTCLASFSRCLSCTHWWSFMRFCSATLSRSTSRSLRKSRRAWILFWASAS